MAICIDDMLIVLSFDAIMKVKFSPKESIARLVGPLHLSSE